MENFKEKPSRQVTKSSLLRRYEAYKPCEEALMVRRFLQLKKCSGENPGDDTAEALSDKPNEPSEGCAQIEENDELQIGQTKSSSSIFYT